MLYPRENRVRGVIDLGGVWNFKLGDEKEPGDSFAMGEDTELMAVPASYNDQKDDPKYRNHYGWAYYERKITVPSYLKGQRLVLQSCHGVGKRNIRVKIVRSDPDRLPHVAWRVR